MKRSKHIFLLGMITLSIFLLPIYAVKAQTATPPPTQTPPIPSPTPSLQEQITTLENQLQEINEQVKTPTKDIWDKLEAISGIISGGVIAIIGLFATHVYRERQRETERQHNEQELAVARIQTVQSFMPQLQSKDKRVLAAAVKAIATIDLNLSLELADIFASEGGTSALHDLKASTNPQIAQQANQSLKAVLESLRDAVVQISDGEKVRGSGFFVKPDGYVLTVDFVISDLDDVHVVYKGKEYAAKLVRAEPDKMLSLLKIEGEALPALPLRISQEASYLDEIFLLGPSPDLGWIVATGKITGTDIVLDDRPGQRFISTSIQLSPGYAGVPAVDRDNRIVGIAAITHINRWTKERVSLLIPAQDILHFITSNTDEDSQQ